MRLTFNFIIFILLIFPPIGFGNYEFDSRDQAQQFDNLIKEFRCVTCPNQNIADSQAPVAKAMKEEIYQRFIRGDSDVAIREYLLSHYGDYVSYRPPIKMQNMMLWCGPFIMLGLGFLFWFKIFSGSKRK